MSTLARQAALRCRGFAVLASISRRRVVVGDRARQRAHPLEERGAREQRTGVRRAELNVISCCVRACATDTSHPAPLKLFKEPSMERVLARRTYY